MNRIIITAAIAAALAFSSCSTDDGEPVKKKSSSSRGGSSSSSGGNSSIGDGDSSSSIDGNSSSSSSRGDGSNSSGTSKTYSLADYDDEYFTYLEEEKLDYCDEGGILKFQIETNDNTVYYSIEDNILTWESDYSLFDGDTIQFNGSSAELRGTWTRTKDKEASCELQEGDDLFSWYECKSNYDITRAVFTSSTVTITRDVCETDGAVTDSEIYGWKIKVVDCNTVEYSKGSNKITEKTTETSEEVKYNNQTCKLSFAETDKRAACQDAWGKYQEEEEEEEDIDIDVLDYYYKDAMELTQVAYDNCLKSKLPKEFLEDFNISDGYDDCEDDPDYCEDIDAVGKLAAKPAVKAKVKAKIKAKAKTKTKFTPLWKKKK